MFINIFNCTTMSIKPILIRGFNDYKYWGRIDVYNDTYATTLNEKIFGECMGLRQQGKLVVGTYCAFTPKEIIVAAGGIPVSLCAGSKESAEKSEIHLPRNLCDLIKSSYGHAISDSCPYFHYADHLIADATCDGKKKMFELLSKIKDLHILDLPKTYETQASHDYFKNELVKIKKRLEDIHHEEITTEKLNDAIRLYNNLKRSMTKLYELNKNGYAIVYGREIKSVVNGISFECNLETRIEEIDEAIRYFEKRAGGKKQLEEMKNKPTILLTGCPTTNDKLVNIIEDNGGIIVASENCGGLKTIEDLVEEDTVDPLEALTDKYLNIACPCMSPNKKRMTIIERLIKLYEVDAVIELTWHACHTYNVESILIKEVSENNGVPYLQIATDYSEGDTGQILTRVQALFEQL